MDYLIENDAPQPQDGVAFGLLTTNIAPISDSFSRLANIGGVPPPAKRIVVTGEAYTEQGL